MEESHNLSKQVENNVGKGEIARYEQFLLFPQCFQKACFPEASKGVIVWEWVNATLKAEVISWRSVTHMCFLAFSHQYKHNFSFQSHRLLFSHASAEVRGENTPERKSRLNRGSNSKPPGHEFYTLTPKPPGRGVLDLN